MTDRMARGVRWRLSVLWFLEWGITGAILTYAPLYFEEYGLSARQLGRLMAVTAVGLWIAPWVVGQVCDRWMAAEKYLAISHFVGGLSLLAIPIATRLYNLDNSAWNFNTLLVLVGLYAVAYFPTIPLASALTFRHLPDPDAQFGKIRIWGTVGWVAAGLFLSLWLGRGDVLAWLKANYPNSEPAVERFAYFFRWLAGPTSSDSFRLAAVLSFALSSFCVFLPKTPPARTGPGAIAPWETLAMFRDRTFTGLIVISFLLALAVPLYTLEMPRLLAEMGYAGDWIPALMTIGQISEFPALLLLAVCLKRLGLKATFALGMTAWLVRYVFFAIGSPSWLVLTGVALHGVCHVFLIVVIQLFVDARCRRDLRASAQNLFTFITAGIGMPIGFLAGGYLAHLCENPLTGRADYSVLFSLAAAFVGLVLAGSLVWFRRHPLEEMRRDDGKG